MRGRSKKPGSWEDAVRKVDMHANGGAALLIRLAVGLIRLDVAADDAEGLVEGVAPAKERDVVLLADGRLDGCHAGGQGNQCC